MTVFAVLKPKTYSYLTNDNDENKKAKGTRKCAVKKLDLKIINIFQKQFNFKIKKNYQKKLSWRRNHKLYIKKWYINIKITRKI